MKEDPEVYTDADQREFEKLNQGLDLDACVEGIADLLQAREEGRLAENPEENKDSVEVDGEKVTENNLQQLTEIHKDDPEKLWELYG